MNASAAPSDYGIARQVLLQSILKGTPVTNRATLGPNVPLKLFQVLRLIGMGTSVESMVGAGAPALVYQSGQQLGLILGEVVYGLAGNDINAYLKHVRELVKDLMIGLVVLEKSDTAKNRLTLKVDECVSCAGIAGVKAPICHWETGMVGGLVKYFVSVGKAPRDVKATEVRCNAIGDNTCAIDVQVRS